MKAKRWIAFVLTVLMVAQTAVLAVNAQATGTPYNGDVLAVINTDYKTEKTVSFEAEGVEAATAKKAGHVVGKGEYLCGTVDNVVPLSPEEAAKKEAEYAGQEPVEAQASYRIGSKKTIFTGAGDSLDIEAPNLKDMMKTTRVECVYIGEYCTVWNEIGGEKTAEECRNLGEYLDSVISKELEIFGNKRIDMDGDGKTAFFVYKMGTENLGGYFNPVDLMDSLGRINGIWCESIGIINALYSNHLDCLHINSIADEETIKLISVHEYQHFINQSWNFEKKGDQSSLTSTKKEMYLTEGFSTAAEYLVYGEDRYSSSFGTEVYYAESQSMLQWDQMNYSSYVLIFPFMQYIRTRYAQIAGDLDAEIPGVGIYQKVLAARQHANGKPTIQLIADLLYPVAQYPRLKDSDARARQLLEDYWLAVILRENSGVHGFNGEAWAEEWQIPLKSIYDEYDRRVCGSMAGFYDLMDVDGVTVDGGNADLRIIPLQMDKYQLVCEQNDGTGEKYEYTFVDRKTYVPDAFREGYTLLGWADTADAGEPVYKVNERISLPRDSVTVLYAVWEKNADISLNEEVDVTAYKAFNFTPAESGVYYVQTNGYAEFVSQEDSMDSFYSEERECRVYSLTAGVTYALRCFPNEEETMTLTVKKVDRAMKLTYVLDAENCEVQWGETTYTVMNYDEYLLMDMDYAKQFIGWTTKQNATEAEYRPGEKVTPTEDMTLYPVLTENEKLTAGTKSVTIAYAGMYKTMLFTPEASGQYKIKLDNALALTVVDLSAAEKMPSVLCNEAAGTVTLTMIEGHTYAFHFQNLTEKMDKPMQCSFSMKKVSSKSGIFLYYDNNAEMLSGTFFYNEGKYTYTVSAVEPFDPLGNEFLGWSLYPDATEPMFVAGDVLELSTDTTLYAVWTKEHTTANLDLRGFSLVKVYIQMIKWNIKLYILTIKEYLGLA